MFVVSTTVCNGYDNIAVPKLIAEIWEHDDIAKKESHVGQRNKQPSNRPATDKLTV